MNLNMKWREGVQRVIQQGGLLDVMDLGQIQEILEDHQDQEAPIQEVMTREGLRIQEDLIREIQEHMIQGVHLEDLIIEDQIREGLIIGDQMGEGRIQGGQMGGGQIQGGQEEAHLIQDRIQGTEENHLEVIQGMKLICVRVQTKWGIDEV